MNHSFGRRRRSGGVVENHRVPLAFGSDPLEIRVPFLDQILVTTTKLGSQRAGGGGRIVRHEDEARNGGSPGEQGDGFEDEIAGEVIDEDELLAVAEEHGDGAGVETEVDGVKDGTGHGDGEVKLVHLGDVGG
ncbi:LOW QUALITY PROTEIN: hypothetical protein TorRG33x02_256480 [Trema orientale]|uniref:Uncharacterized protein n=1 Tax=Trema orientale TaxID=63057 RepID=A0A2P5DB27_TREOI|nr:LOW QUALITY PROTEIN: hypothetical protein TorRG33x02_256480 [Trema orientale]